jgi:hypothetical protein
MKKLQLIIVLLLLLKSCNCFAYEFAEDWNEKDTAYQATFILVTLVDWKQTHWMSSNDWNWDGSRHKELNPVFSDHPSKSNVDTIIPLGLISHTLISLALPPKPRRIWQMLFIAIEVGAVTNNFATGVRIEF